MPSLSHSLMNSHYKTTNNASSLGLKKYETAYKLKEKLCKKKQANGEWCCFCQNPNIGFGNNPSTYDSDLDNQLKLKQGHRCCDECNTKVIATRVAILKSKKN